MVVTLPGHMAEYLPVDYELVMTYGVLEARNKNEGGTRQIRFTTEANQAGRVFTSGDLECQGVWENVHGPGIALALMSLSHNRGRFVAFTNRNGSTLVVTEPAKGLPSNATRAMVKSNSMFGPQLVPFRHTDASLQKFIWDVIDLAQPDKLNYFGFLAAHRNNGKGSLEHYLLG